MVSTCYILNGSQATEPILFLPVPRGIHSKSYSTFTSTWQKISNTTLSTYYLLNSSQPILLLGGSLHIILHIHSHFTNNIQHHIKHMLQLEYLTAVVKWGWFIELRTLFINTSNIYVHSPCSMRSRCYVLWEVGNQYICATKYRLLDRCSREQFLKLNEVVIQHPPFWEYDTLQFNSTNEWGCRWWHITRTRSVDSLGQQFLDFLDQASGCPVGMARSSWLHRCGMGCHRHWCWGVPLNSWCGRNNWSLVHLGCWCCRCGLHALAGGGSAVCAAEKQCLVGACGVAVVPLGTVSTALILHSQRCLHVCQYVEPLLVHTW